MPKSLKFFLIYLGLRLFFEPCAYEIFNKKALTNFLSYLVCFFVFHFY